MNSDGLENGDERLGRRTPWGGKPGGGYSEEAERPEAGSGFMELDLGGDDPGLEGGDIGLDGDPGPGGDLDTDPGTWAEMRDAEPDTRSFVDLNSEGSG